MLFKEKLVAVMGTGIEGLSSATFLKAQGAFVTLLDQKTKDQLDPEIVSKAQELGVEVNWGPACLNSLERFEVLVRTPGIRPDVAEIQEAINKGKILTSNTKIFFELCPATIIGVTGTKGKGTTATLISEILKRSNKNVFLGGNIGTPALDLLAQLKQGDYVVLELSSFQLFDLEKSPHVAVVLMVTSEHLDWHKNIDEYKNAKFNIASHQGPGDFTVVNIDYTSSSEFLNIGQGHKIPVSSKQELTAGVFIANDMLYRRIGTAAERILQISEVGLIGAHNLENVIASIGAATALEIAVEPVATAIKNFKGLENRLEFVREIDGVKYYNDTFSTTPETAIAAIKSFSAPEIVILGGSDKGSDYSELGRTIVSALNIKEIILIGQMAPKIKEAIAKAGNFKGAIREGAKNMEEIVSQAREASKEGDVVLLSPACASFDMFKNYKQRGFLFKEIISKI